MRFDPRMVVRPYVMRFGLLAVSLAALVLLPPPVNSEPAGKTKRVSATESGTPEAEASPADETASPPERTDYRANARPLSHHIQRVTVYSDRAQVARSASVSLKPGFQWLHLASLPANLTKESLVVSAGKAFQGRITQVVLEDAFEHVNLPPDVRKKLESLRREYANLLELKHQENALEQYFKVVQGLRYDEPFTRDQAKQPYRSFSAHTDRLIASMDEIQHESGELSVQLRKVQAQIESQQRRVSYWEDELKNVTSASEQKWMTQVYVGIDSKTAQSTSLEVKYLIPDAKWHPLYDVRAELNPETGTTELRLVTSALVEQHTGESWNDVELTLSTLDPVPLFQPRLARWVLSEIRTPKGVAVSDDNGAAGVSDMEFAKQDVTRNFRVGRSGLNQAQAAAPKPMPLKKGKPRHQITTDAKDGIVTARANAPPSAPVAAAQSAGIDAVSAPSEEVAESEPQNDAKTPSHDLFPLVPLEKLFPDLGELEKAVAKVATSGNERPFDLHGQSAPPSRAHYDDPKLPAVQAGGRVFEFTSPFRVDLESDEAPLKIPVLSQRLQGELVYFAIPKKDSRVFLRTKAINEGTHPLLAGDAQIFMDGDLVSRTELATVPEQGKFTVDLGVDKNIETNRTVTKNAGTAGLLKNRHVTDVEVKIQVANHQRFNIKLDLRDLYPLAPDDKIEIALKEVSPKPKSQKDGILHWELALAPTEEKTVTFHYQVSHPENFIVSEFD